MSVSVIDSLKDAVVVAPLVCDCENVFVDVAEWMADSDSVNDHCSGVFETVSVNDLVEDAVVVAFLVCDWDNVCVCVAVS